MKQRWRFADLLDLDFFLNRDREILDNGREDELAERDRTLYLQIRDACGRDLSSVDRACLLRQWLSGRRAEYGRGSDDAKVLPGELFSELIRICGWSLFLLALVIGWGGAFSFLSYSGTTPVNVSLYFLVFVCSQMLVLLALPISFAIRRLLGGDALPLTSSLLRRGLLRLAVRLDRFSGAVDARRWLADLSGGVRRRQRTYGLLATLPFFLLVQLGGIGFNLGVLAATLFKVVGTDIAFGWQSTLQVGSETVFKLVRAVALPWSWFLPVGVGYPDPMQIKGSQMVLKDGIYHLATGDLVSWWPFLCLSVAVYCLLPRICLLLAGRQLNHSLLGRLDFNTALQRQLLHRMLTPRLSTESDREQLETREEKDEKKEERKKTLKEHAAPRAGGQEGEDEPVEEQAGPRADGRLLALIPDELFDDCDAEQLKRLVLERLGQGIERCLRLNLEVDEEQVFLELEGENPSELDALLLLQEAWQPPIEEFFFLLHRLRDLVGEKVLLSIVFIGKPTAKTIFTAAGEQDYRIWRRKIDALGDPWLHCVRLVES